MPPPHPPRRRPAALYQPCANPSLCPLHPSPHKHPLVCSGYNNVKKTVISLKGQRIARQFVTRTTTTTSTTTSAPSAPRALRLNARPAAAKQGVVLEDEQDPFMATVFLQFCPTCERQIMIPSDSILYCSESCRRKDSSKPLDLSHLTTRNMASSKRSPPASPPFTPKAIVAPIAPTQAASCSNSPLQIPVKDLEDPPSGLDLPKWQPKINHQATNALTSTEAFRYLSLFQTTNPPSSVTSSCSNINCKTTDDNATHHNINNSTTAMNTTTNNNADNGTTHPRPVPIAYRSSTSISTTSGQSTTQVPSLAHSPSTSAASSMLDSPTEPMAAYMPTTITTHALPQPTTHHQRVSLPPRHNAGSDTNSKPNFDLAMPYIVADPNDHASGPTIGENENRSVTAAGTVGNGGDGCLLR
ncbi:uncharacterized protein BDCG_00084 [Blastomyces dermatitidis ER-3]|uniref:Life-span regulatory factor domain-containing protein n=1 Tax=Ajellomyces dermatitidis (strain ER-3 / ATCC MYA-2586) TaxID=559297 RepID=A0ABP2ELB8_AJEDR|nr:uncharacterized protein BDCG_00084 [Blastomyces dermatitidis ER-3]EEQ83279.1 hypothetical protein BDCG_00084 [Blastomyces dermatitidis ER-3]